MEENKARFTILVVPNNKKRVLSFAVSSTLAVIVPIFIGLLILVWVYTEVSSASKISNLNNDLLNTQTELDNMKSENILLQADAEDMQQIIADAQTQIETLQNSEAESSEEKIKKFIPDSFPVAGAVGLPTEYSDENPYRQFSMADGTRVIATADGKVKSVTTTDNQNVIEIDHGNGYVSRYTCRGIVTVNEGDSVLRQTTILVATNKFLDPAEAPAEGEAIVLTYEMEVNGVAMDPMTMIEVNG